ncbi:hypothetical protein [Senegalia massiliensis]|uniref:Uncharacterized protein n=1 Tax=Senegalia massiliensis TaxID=1720316 RepID=A0A845R3R5_9CLOT|nr:hypothetical protein [Senegalia massiliensis]NBI08238.1 hypothetical protein [Senegalia massiliensis]
MKLNILGQEYEVLLLTEEEYPKLKHLDANGIAELYNKQLIINKDGTVQNEVTFDNLKAFTSKVIRHEIVHAYFHESGLMDYCNDERLVDWIALQLPKMANTIDDFEKNQEDFYK